MIVTIAPDADVASESLGALRFASRAAKVKVVAKVSQYQDYEAMYREMKDQFESMSRQRKEERDGELFKDSYVDIITCKDQIIEQRGLEIADLKRQLAAYISSAADYPAPTIQKPSKQSILSGSNVRGDVGDDENAHTNKLLSEQQWVDRVECLKAEHTRALDSLKSQHSISLIKSQQSELKCKQELINTQVLSRLSSVAMYPSSVMSWHVAYLTCFLSSTLRYIGRLESRASPITVHHAAAPTTAREALR